MTNELAMILSGFLFLFIIITNITSERFGYETFSDLDSAAKLQQINTDPKKFGGGKHDVNEFLTTDSSFVCPV